eukprot:g2264.t1
MASNFNDELLDLEVTEYPDIIRPIIIRGEIDMNNMKNGNGKLVLKFSETIDLMTSEKANLTKMFLSNVTGEETILLESATVFTEEFAPSMTIFLPEALRVKAIQHSNTPGGDKTGLFLLAKSGCVRDIAQNDVHFIHALPINETADTTLPQFVEASINYGTGLLLITFTETIDITPASLVYLGNIYLSEKTQDNNIQLSGASTLSLDSLTVSITLREDQRVAALIRSGTRGGDNSSLVLDIYKDAIQDIAKNRINKTLNSTIQETRDKIDPKVLNASINYNNGVFIFQASETIDLQPRSLLNLNLIHLRNTHGDASRDTINLDGHRRMPKHSYSKAVK